MSRKTVRKHSTKSIAEVAPQEPNVGKMASSAGGKVDVTATAPKQQNIPMTTGGRASQGHVATISQTPQVSLRQQVCVFLHLNLLFHSLPLRWPLL